GKQIFAGQDHTIGFGQPDHGNDHELLREPRNKRGRAGFGELDLHGFRRGRIHDGQILPGEGRPGYGHGNNNALRVFNRSYFVRQFCSRARVRAV
ncbi:MAG: hypothetical protein CO103_08380, partial [Chloroflexi bacterium CG_4_9_14_3_um_filter_45_9]